MIRRRIFIVLLIAVSNVATFSHAAGEKLYGVHWWDYNYPNVGQGPTGGWSVETIVTNSVHQWSGAYFRDLYQQVATTHQANVITRIDYNWGQTVPAPTTMTAQNWSNRIFSEVINPLGDYSRRWVIGNEPNLISEGNGWASNQITPAGYAQIYKTVRDAIKAQRPQDEVLFAPVSPGGVVASVRWKDGNQWLAQAIDATLALPGGAIDGFAIHAYGNPTVNANTAVAEFRTDFSNQLAVIDSRGLTDVPVYMTEWNRATSTTGDLSANEQTSANFLRRSLINVDEWNRTPGNHNIVSLAWFIMNDTSGWEQYSIKWWKTRGNPVGHQHDLWTALMQSNSLQAGMVGTRPLADYNADSVVDAADYIAWRNAFGTNSPYVDGNRDSKVDAADYVLWRISAAIGGAGSTFLPVPESGVGSTLLSVTSFGILSRLPRRSHSASNQ